MSSLEIGQQFTTSTGAYGRTILDIQGDRVTYGFTGARRTTQGRSSYTTTVARFRWWVRRECSGSTTPVQRGRGLNTIEYFPDYAELVLTNKDGQEVGRAKVSLSDLPRLQEFGMRWSLQARTPTHHYAELRLSKGHKRVVSLHRFLLDAPDEMLVDHINRDTLDNRRENLRLVTHAQNSQNQGAYSTTKTGIKNVCWDRTTGKYRVYLQVKGRNRTIGYFDTLEEAAEAAKQARLTRQTHSPDHTYAKTRIDGTTTAGINAAFTSQP